MYFERLNAPTPARQRSREGSATGRQPTPAMTHDPRATQAGVRQRSLLPWGPGRCPGNDRGRLGSSRTWRPGPAPSEPLRAHVVPPRADRRSAGGNVRPHAPRRHVPPALCLCPAPEVEDHRATDAKHLVRGPQQAAFEDVSLAVGVGPRRRRQAQSPGTVVLKSPGTVVLL
jgi:hypothetical protein